MNIEWFIIGYGDDSLIQSALAQEQMEDHVHLLGKKANPYPYIAHCDWYIQPSRYEGKSIAVTEAQILGKPVMVTAYPTAASQITPGKDGLIVPMDTPESTSQAIGVALRDTDTREQMISYLQTHDYGNAAEVEKVYQLLS